MVLLFHSDIDRADWWVPELERRLPDLDIRVWPDSGARQDIEFALVWRPPAGLLASCPNLKAILSLGAGVDHLFADPELPSTVPIARVGRRWIDKFSNQKATAILNLKMALEDKHREEETDE